MTLLWTLMRYIQGRLIKEAQLLSSIDISAQMQSNASSINCSIGVCFTFCSTIQSLCVSAGKQHLAINIYLQLPLLRRLKLPL